MMIDYIQVIKEENKKCILDPAYFIKSYCKIEHPMKGLIPFDLYSYQQHVLNEYQKYRFNIVLKSRQLGITTTTAAFCFWLMFFQKNKKIQVLATKQKVATNIVTMIKVMYTNLPSWLQKIRKPTRDGWNSLSIKFDNGSEIFAQSTTEDAGRSSANSLVVIDEDAFIPRMDKVWPSIEQTLATGGACIRLSTPNGQANHFYETWNKSVLGENEFNRILLRWDVHPDRDQKWRDAQDKILGPKLAAQECLDGETKVIIRNKQTGFIEQITLNDLYEKM